MESHEEAIDKMVYWMTLGLKMGRIREILMKMGAFRSDIKSFENTEVHVIGNSFQEAVQNFNNAIGQKV